MTNREKYKQAFSVLRASEDFYLEANHMKRFRLRKAAVLAAACIMVIGSATLAYAVDVGGIQRTVQLWLHGDQTCTGVIGNRHERRTRLETARRLISPVEYATAETIWDGKPGLIAGELNVTQEIVEDYRSMLRDMIPHEREKALHGAATP